jgi:hypothetical protein
MSQAALHILPQPGLAFARQMRREDRFHPAQDAERLLAALYPATPSELALDLSRVTSLFYGLLLQVAHDQFGAEVIDAMSRALFYRLGRMKARAAHARHTGELHGDTRDLVTILIAAIYDASPEYVFQVERHEPDVCSVTLSGVDRYYRAASELNLVHHLRWPTLHPFFEGIRDELGIACDVESWLVAVKPGAHLTTRYLFQAPAGG